MIAAIAYRPALLIMMFKHYSAADAHFLLLTLSVSLGMRKHCDQPRKIRWINRDIGWLVSAWHRRALQTCASWYKASLKADLVIDMDARIPKKIPTLMQLSSASIKRIFWQIAIVAASVQRAKGYLLYLD